MKSTELGILGAGGQAREAAELAGDSNIAFHAVSADFVTGPGLIDVAAPSAAEAGLEVIAAVGPPGLRRKLVEAWPGTRYRTLASPRAHISPSARIGAGCLIAPGAVISSNVAVGDHVIVNIGATVSHDCELGDFATVSPGANVGGGCVIGDGAFLGIGSTVRDHVRIGAGVTIGAGAVVLADALELGIYVGAPARLIRSTDDWLWSL